MEETKNKSTNFIECPYCGSLSLKWREECSYSDLGFGDKGEGIVIFYDCESCGCTVQVWKTIGGEYE